jgi:predicted O-methyltransferase YrrM
MQTRRSPEWFSEVRRRCRGMLPVEIYQALYEEARKRPHENILEVGTGRGPGSVCFAAGLADAGGKGRLYTMDLFYQGKSARPHKYTLETNPNDAQKRNVQVYRNNLRFFGVLDGVTIIPGKTEEAWKKLPPGIRFGTLFIDTDGLIDRDLALFYNLVTPGGRIILDDILSDANVDLTTVRHAGKSLTQARAHGDPRRWLDTLSGYRRKRIMGKQFLATKLLDRFVDAGILARDYKIDTSDFLIKSGPETLEPSAFLKNNAKSQAKAAFLRLYRQAALAQ